MNKVEFKEKQKEIMTAYQNKIEAEPEVKKWIDHKKILRYVGVIYILIYFGIEICAILSINAQPEYTRLLLKAAFCILWYLFFISPSASWKLGIMFYVSAIYNSMNVITAYTKYNGFDTYFQNGPLWAIYFIMSILLIVLFFVLACWLTIPKKNRELSDRAQELFKEYSEDVKQLNNSMRK